MEGTPWPRKLQGQLQGRVVGDMRLKMPPRCPRLGQPIQSLSTAIPLGALSITFLWLPGLTSLPSSYSKCRAQSQAVRAASRIP